MEGNTIIVVEFKISMNQLTPQLNYARRFYCDKTKCDLATSQLQDLTSEHKLDFLFKKW